MIINLTPQRRDDALIVTRTADVLMINGTVFDFGPMGEGDTLPVEAIDSEWFTGPVTRVDGVLAVTLLLPLPANYSPAQAFPAPLYLTADGPVALPEPLPEPDPPCTEDAA